LLDHAAAEIASLNIGFQSSVPTIQNRPLSR